MCLLVGCCVYVSWSVVWGSCLCTVLEECVLPTLPPLQLCVPMGGARPGQGSLLPLPL